MLLPHARESTPPTIILDIKSKLKTPSIMVNRADKFISQLDIIFDFVLILPKQIPKYHTWPIPPRHRFKKPIHNVKDHLRGQMPLKLNPARSWKLYVFIPEIIRRLRKPQLIKNGGA